MDRSGWALPAWTFGGLCLGLIFGFGLGVAIGGVAGADRDTSASWVIGAFLGGTCAIAGAVVGAVRDILGYLEHRLPSQHGPEADYRDPPTP